MEPRIIERHTSPDGLLTLSIIDFDGDIAVGFEGRPWHTHPECLYRADGASDDDALREFVADVIAGRTLLAVSRIAGEMKAVWPTSDPAAEFKHKPPEEKLEFRYWDGTLWEST